MSFEFKAILAAILLAVLVGLGWYAHHAVYEEGVVAGSAKVQKQWDDATQLAKKNADKQKAQADKAIKPLDDKAQPQIQQSQERVVTVVKTVTKVIHDNPTFAAVNRPADLDRVRQDQLKAVAAAAGGFAPAPSSSSAGSGGASTGAAERSAGGH